MRMLALPLTQLTGHQYLKKETSTILITTIGHFHMFKHQTRWIPISKIDLTFLNNLKKKDLEIHLPNIKPIKSLI
jgi:hypothetical protein